MYLEKFKTTELTLDDEVILEEFIVRRKLFDDFIRDRNLEVFTCPACGFPTLKERGGYEICCVCDWEDDFQDDENCREILGGASYNLSLIENRLIIGRTLNKLSKSLKGNINNNCLEVLAILKSHENRKNEISEYFLRSMGALDFHLPTHSPESKKVFADLIKLV